MANTDTSFVLPVLHDPNESERLANAWRVAYSRKYNSRRLEAQFYAPWTLILGSIVHRDTRLCVSPQHTLYAAALNSKLFASDSVSSMTNAEPHAVSILPDFVISYSHRSVNRPGVPAGEKKEWNGKKLTRLYIPIIAEAKHAAPRSLQDQTVFVSRLDGLMIAAQLQAQWQGGTLYKNTLYSQKTVILVACVGEWWTWRIYTRVQAQQDSDREESDDEGNDEQRVIKKEPTAEELKQADDGDDLNIQDLSRFKGAETEKASSDAQPKWPIDSWSKHILFGSPVALQKLHLIDEWLKAFTQTPDSPKVPVIKRK